jgi:predicted PurR-regulated permease PerM
VEASVSPEADHDRQRVAVATVIVVAIVGATALVVYCARVLLVAFAGLILGVLLDAMTEGLMRWTRLRRGAALGLVCFTLVGALVGLGALVVPRLAEQASSLAQKAPPWLSQAWSGQHGDAPQASRTRAKGEGAKPLDQVGDAIQQADPAVVRPVVRSISIGLGALGNIVMIIVIGMYAAAWPDGYRDGFVRLLPQRWRDRAREALAETAHQLRRWLIGTGIAMASAGALTGVGLWLLGVPYALGLALVAAFGELVPNFGPIVAAVPAVALTLGDEGHPWWHVALLYLGIQTVQSYLIQPLTQERMVHVPPVLLITSLVLGGWLLGVVGLLLAVPVLVVILVLVRQLYLRDTLHETAAPQPTG